MNPWLHGHEKEFRRHPSHKMASTIFLQLLAVLHPSDLACKQQPNCMQSSARYHTVSVSCNLFVARSSQSREQLEVRGCSLQVHTLITDIAARPLCSCSFIVGNTNLISMTARELSRPKRSPSGFSPLYDHIRFVRTNASLTTRLI